MDTMFFDGNLFHDLLVLTGAILLTYFVFRWRGFSTERTQLLQEIAGLRTQLTDVLFELAEAKGQILILNDKLSRVEQQAKFPQRPNDNEILVVEGTDRNFFEADLQALRGAGWSGRFKRLEHGTQERLRQELQRRRLAGTLPRILHISAHSGETILLADGPADGNFWSENLANIEGVFFAGCGNVLVGDAIDGLVRWQISTREQLENADASAFARAFYQRLIFMPPAQAYTEACELVPTMREYVDFRERTPLIPPS